MEHTSLSPVAPGTAGIEPERKPPADAVKVRALAEQFEAMLLSQMLRDMKESMTPDADRGGLGAPIMADTVHTELGLSLSRAGGVGLADVLMKALDAYRVAGDDVEATTPVTTTALPDDPHAAGLTTMPTETITSGYGWRSDPISGKSRFHHGVDLRYAYGQEVHAAAPGIVTFAGDKDGYGTTVVIDHGNGLETRYAHLSSAEVREGSQVSAGELIARSGNSGRSTGPHLHFEVRQDGRAKDPSATADFLTYRSATPGSWSSSESGTR